MTPGAKRKARNILFPFLKSIGAGVIIAVPKLIACVLFLNHIYGLRTFHNLTCLSFASIQTIFC